MTSLVDGRAASAARPCRRVRRRWQGRVAAAAVLLAGLALTCGGGLLLTAGTAAPAAAVSVGSVPPAAPDVPTGSGPSATATPMPSPSPSPPTAIRIPALGVRAAVVPVLAPGGALDVPADPQVIGWWSAGPRPGSAAGTVVLAGHVDTAEHGLGAFAALARAEPGTRIELVTRPATVRYVVVARVRYPKSTLPPDVLASYGRPRLALLTCGGAFDERTRHYADNIVVVGLPEA